MAVQAYNIRAWGATVLLVSSIPLMSQASAQETASIPARASIGEQTTQLSLSLLDTTNFGTVNRPNGTRPGATCRYQMGLWGPSQSEEIARIEELDPSGNVVKEGGPTPSGCGAGESNVFDPIYNGGYGSVYINCNGGLDVQISSTYSQAGVAGIEFGPTENLNNLSVWSGDGVYVLQAVTGRALSQTCPNDPESSLIALVGAQLTIDETAQLSPSAIEVGSVTLEVSY